MSSIWTMRRSATDTKVAGVCGGVAQHWNVDPVLVRVACALLALSGGVGIVLYAAAWLFIPVEGSDSTVAQDVFGEQSRRWPKELVVAVVVVASLVAFAILSSVTPFGFGPAVILALIWYFGYYKNRPQRSASAPAEQPPGSLAAPAAADPGQTGPAQDSPAQTSPAQTTPVQATPVQASTSQPVAAQSFHYPGPATPFTQAAEAWQRRIAENLSATQQREDRTEPTGLANPIAPGSSINPSPSITPPQSVRVEAVRPSAAPTDLTAYFAHPDPAGIYVEPVAPVATVTRRVASRASRRIRAVGLLSALLVIAGLAIAESLGVTVPLVAYLAAPLGVIGLTLVASTWVGRARGLLPLGIALLLALGVTTVVQQIPPPQTWSSTVRAYTAVSDLPAGGDRIDAGTLAVDLSQLNQTGNASYQAHADLGAVVITVPSDVNVVVRYRIDAGSFTALGETVTGGTDLDSTWSSPLLDDRPTLTLDLSAGLGEIEVHQ